jgi:hypothetical protein
MGLPIFDISKVGMVADENPLEITNDVEVPLMLEYKDIQ